MMRLMFVLQGSVRLRQVFSGLGIILAVVSLAVPTSGQAAVVAYKGIAYAEPPVSDARWRAPKDRELMAEALRDARDFGAACPGSNSPFERSPKPTSEDCLSLNVWTPDQQGNAPVMVWIHGGAFRWGNGNVPGELLAREGVVVVSLNYRLGPLGFFEHPELADDAGNFALLDMVSALRWVQRHIAEFGGDPAQVTIFGVSAGGMAVNMLSVSPLAQGLFTRAIAQSGYATWPLLHRESLNSLPRVQWDGAPVASATSASDALLDRLAVQDRDLDRLRQLDADSLVSAVEGFQLPIVDGVSLNNEPAVCFADADCSLNIEAYMTGANSAEGEIMPGTGITVSMLKAQFPGWDDRISTVYASDAAKNPDLAWQRYFGDLRYLTSALITAQGTHARKLPTYTYWVDVMLPVGLTNAPPKLAGMPHGADSALFWGQLDPIPGMQELGAQLRRAWSDFAKGVTVLAGDWQPWTTPSGYWQSVMDAQGSVQAALAPRLTVVAEAYARRYPTSLQVNANLNANE